MDLRSTTYRGSPAAHALLTQVTQYKNWHACQKRKVLKIVSAYIKFQFQTEIFVLKGTPPGLAQAYASIVVIKFNYHIEVSCRKPPTFEKSPTLVHGTTNR